MSNDCKDLRLPSLEIASKACGKPLTSSLCTVFRGFSEESVGVMVEFMLRAMLLLSLCKKVELAQSEI